MSELPASAIIRFGTVHSSSSVEMLTAYSLRLVNKTDSQSHWLMRCPLTG
eukprot:COSAG01_NODE_67799_length_266_cov_0.568862_1_plen_49_part_01